MEALYTMILGIKTETGVKQIPNVLGWKKYGELILIDSDKGLLTELFENLVLGVASDGFVKSRLKPFLNEGYKNIEE